MSNPLYVGDVGAEIVIDTQATITNSTVRSILAMKPDYTHADWTATSVGDTSIKYVTQQGDLDVPGIWELQPYIETPDWKGFGDVVELVVKPIL